MTNTALAIARALTVRGFAVIPVPFQSKAPTLKGWQNLRLTAADLAKYFDGAPTNIGVLLGEPSGWVVDIDLDHPLAVQMAGDYLPKTGAVFGRKSKPRSHYLYRVPEPVKTTKEQSKTAGMLVELRSSGCQTVVPGSIHPTGEVIQWHDEGEPSRVNVNELLSAVAALADAVRAELGEQDEAPAPAPRSAVAYPHLESPYVQAAVVKELDSVRLAPEGTRNDALNSAAFSLGTIVGAGALNEGELVANLAAAAQECGLPENEASATIASGLSSGKAQPRQLPASISKTRAAREPVKPRLAAAHPFVPFPVGVLPEPIGSFVADAATAMGCDASYIALPMLSGLASAIGNTHCVVLKRGWTEPAIVWTAIVGEPSTLKSPAIEVALLPIRKRQQEAMKRHAAKMDEYGEALAVYEREAAHWRRSKSDTPAPASPEPPIVVRCWMDDVTTEVVAVLLQQNPRGLLLARDELSGWFNFDRYSGGKGGDAAKWLEMWGGRPMMVDRKTSGTIYVPRTAVSIAGGIQPKTLWRALGEQHRDNGLAARLLLAHPPSVVHRWTEADVDPAGEAAVAAVFDRLYTLTMEPDQYSPGVQSDERPRLVMLAPDAKAAWIKYYDAHATEQIELVGDDAAAWGKLKGYAARLALVIHLTGWAASGKSVRDTGPVGEASIAAGVALALWFGNEARRVYGILGESDYGRQQSLVNLIRRKGGSVTVRDLMRGSSRFNRGNAAEAETALQELAESGLARWEAPAPGTTGGQPTRRLCLVDAVDVDDTAPHSLVHEGTVNVNGKGSALRAGGEAA